MVQEFLPSVRNAILVTPDDSPSSFISDDALPLEILFHCLPWEEILPMKGTLGHDHFNSHRTAGDEATRSSLRRTGILRGDLLQMWVKVVRKYPHYSGAHSQ